jgi:hypothetical protein
MYFPHRELNNTAPRALVVAKGARRGERSGEILRIGVLYGSAGRTSIPEDKVPPLRSLKTNFGRNDKRDTMR